MDNIKQAGYGTLVIVFIIAFLLGYGTSSRIVNRSMPAGGAQNGRGGEAAVTEMEEEAAAEGGASAEPSLPQISVSLGLGVNTVSADNQPAGSSAAVAVKAESAVWVAVHEDMAGKPGKILGAQLFSAGTHFGKVDLLRPTVVGMKYYAMLHSDDGDRRFDASKDKPLTGTSGAHITDEFMTTAGASIQ